MKWIHHPYIKWLLLATVSIVILNELVAWLASTMLSMPYFHFPNSFWFNYEVFQTGNGIALSFSLISLLWVGLFLMGIIGRDVVNRMCLIGAVGLLFGSVFGNLLYVFLGSAELTLSPIAIFSLYFVKGSLYQPEWYYLSYSVSFTLAIIFSVTSIIRMMSTHSYVHGKARFATMIDLLRYGMLKKKQDSLQIGKYQGHSLWLQGFAPVLVLANVGGGKSTAFAIPNIIHWAGSTVNNDTSNELYETTARYLRARGEKVYQFCPMSRKTHRFNPFHVACKLDKAERWGVIERICKKIIPTAKNETSQSWSSMARRVLEGLADYLISTTGYCTLGQLAELCCKGNFNEWLKQEILTNDQVDAQFKVNANAFLNIEAEQTQGGVKFNYEAYIGLYLNPIIRAATEANDFDVTKLRQEKMHLFFGIPDGEVTHLQPLITIFWEEISAELMKKVPNVKEEPYPVLFNIDEFGNSGRLDRIRKNLTTFRKYRVRSIIYLQYKDQVGQDFSVEEARAFNSIPNKVLLSATGSIEDAKYLSSLFGQRTVKYDTRSRQAMHLSGNVNEHLQQKPLISADELMHLNDKQGLVHISGQNGIKFKKSYYFKDRKLSKLLGRKINPDKDKNIPIQAPIEPIVDLSLMKRGLTEEEKAIKQMEKELREQRKQAHEINKIREMTSIVMSSLQSGSVVHNNDSLNEIKPEKKTVDHVEEDME